MLILSDADGQKPKEIVDAVNLRLTRRYGFAVITLVIAEMLEAWFLADPEALDRVLGVKKTFTNPERLRDPKSELRRLQRATVYTPKIAAIIAREIDLNLLTKKCPRFIEFRNAVRR